MAVVALLGTLDTEGVEYAFLRDRPAALGVEALLIDAVECIDAGASSSCRAWRAESATRPSPSRWPNGCTS